jgi:MFS family permease
LSSSSSSNKKEKTSSKVARIFNSAMAFVIAYMLVLFLFSIVTAFIGKIFGFDANISYSGVKFDIGRHKWDQLNIFVIWSFGTFFTILLGIIFFYLFFQFKAAVSLVNMFFLWGTVISFSIVAAQGLLPCIEPGERLACYTNLSVVFAWLSFPTWLLYFVCFFFLSFLVFFSIYTSKPFLSFSYSFSKVSKTNRKRKYYLETVILPYLLASAIILTYHSFTYPSVNFYVINVVYLICVGISLAVSFMVININDMKPEEVLRYKNLQTVSPVMFIIFVLLLIFFTAANKGFYLPF